MTLRPNDLAMREPVEITSIAEDLGLDPSDYEEFGRHKAKLALGLQRKLASRPRGKYILVTSVNPTPLGEGKTVITIGLAMALSRLGKRAVATIREPSLGPVFGQKGGGAGGGQSSLLPLHDINLHFTGDMHAVSSANNLLAAMLDNHIKRGRDPKVELSTVTWRRAIDMNDRGLASIETALDDPPQAPRRKTGFQLTAASEVMAILALAVDVADMRRRLGKITVGLSPSGKAVTAEDIGCAGAMAALLRDAIRPNLVQTCDHTPALVHTGPFGNIAHGSSSVVADLNALGLADYVVTESGFGADCGAEKFFDIKCRENSLWPDAVVLVCTVRALKFQSGRFDVRAGRPLPAKLLTEDLEALREGGVNLEAHMKLLRHFGLPVVVAVNRFPTDTDREVQELRQLALHSEAAAAVETQAYAKGPRGAEALAQAVMESAVESAAQRFLYPLEISPKEKLEVLAEKIYGADGVDLSNRAQSSLEMIEELGLSGLPVCVAKTQYSLSHDPQRLGRPRRYRLPIRDVHISSGAGFLYALAGDIRTMPALPSEPAALRIDLDAEGHIVGI